MSFEFKSMLSSLLMARHIGFVFPCDADGFRPFLNIHPDRSETSGEFRISELAGGAVVLEKHATTYRGSDETARQWTIRWTPLHDGTIKVEAGPGATETVPNWISALGALRSLGWQ